jgi:hypothetical protein
MAPNLLSNHPIIAAWATIRKSDRRLCKLSSLANSPRTSSTLMSLPRMSSPLASLRPPHLPLHQQPPTFSQEHRVTPWMTWSQYSETSAWQAVRRRLRRTVWVVLGVYHLVLHQWQLRQHRRRCLQYCRLPHQRRPCSNSRRKTTYWVYFRCS